MKNHFKILVKNEEKPGWTCLKALVIPIVFGWLWVPDNLIFGIRSALILMFIIKIRVNWSIQATIRLSMDYGFFHIYVSKKNIDKYRKNNLDSNSQPLDRN